MTLDEAILHTEEVAEENQRVIDTGIVFNDVTIDELYCDDTEVIEEHLANYQKYAAEYRQLAEWLKDYKRLLEPKPKAGHWIQENSILRCSICDAGVARYDKYPYCPRCGARMVESEEL